MELPIAEVLLAAILTQQICGISLADIVKYLNKFLNRDKTSE